MTTTRKAMTLKFDERHQVILLLCSNIDITILYIHGIKSPMTPMMKERRERQSQCSGSAPWSELRLGFPSVTI